MAPSQSYIPPVSPQAPINVLTTSMSVTDPAGLAGTIVPLVQQTQPPATPMQLTDIIPQAAPQQTQPGMIPQQTIVQQQQLVMDPQTSTQQPQQQMEAQATQLEQQVSATQPSVEQHQQSLSAIAVQNHHNERQQQIYVQQPGPPVQTTPQQQGLTPQTGMEQRAISLPQPGEHSQMYNQQQTRDPHEQTMIQLQQQLQQQQTLLQQQQQQALHEQHQTYIQQQLDQQQQQALLQQKQQQAQHQQQQLEQQHALIHKQLFDQQHQQALIQQQQEQQQQALAQQRQSQHALLQHQLEQQQQPTPFQQQQQKQLYQQMEHPQGETQQEPMKQQQIGQQQLVMHPQQTQNQKEHQLQQQALLQQVEQQQQQALLQQHLQQQVTLQQQQLQQKAQLQQQQQEQQVQLKQQIEQQQQALLHQLEQQRQQDALLQQQAERLQQQAFIQEIQEQQQATLIQLQQAEKQDAVPFPQSNSDLQIQQKQPEIQHACVPQVNNTVFIPHSSLTGQQVMEQQQQAALILQQQAYVAVPQHPTSAMEPHIPVGAPASAEGIQHQNIISQVQVPMVKQIPVQTSGVIQAQVLRQQCEVHSQNPGQVPVQFIAQSTAQVGQAMIEPQATPPVEMLKGQTQAIQTQKVPLQTSYPGPASQSLVTAQPLIQAQTLQPTIPQSQPSHSQGPTVDNQMMGQQSQSTAQSQTATASNPSQILHETPVHQKAQMPGLLQPQLKQQSQSQPLSQVQGQPAAQYAPQPTHQSMQSLQQDITHIIQQQQQQQPVLQYQQVMMSTGSATTVGAETASLSSVMDPSKIVATLHAVQQAGQAQQQPLGIIAEHLVIQPISQASMSQPPEQYQPQLQKLSQAQQLQASPPPKQQLPLLTQLPTQPTPAPIQQQLPVKQALIPIDETQLPPKCQPASHLVTHHSAQIAPGHVAEHQSQNRILPVCMHAVAGQDPSSQHLAMHMLPAHTHTQTSIQGLSHSHTQTHSQTQSHSHTQTLSETHTAEQPALPHAISPAHQIPLSPSHTSCPPLSLPSFHPTATPAPELPSSPPAAQVTLPGQADFLPTSPPPVTTLELLDSNAPKLPQASLQDCDISLLGISQVH